jgi:hypothetical protein
MNKTNEQLLVEALRRQQASDLISAAPDLLEALEFLLADWIAINGDRITGSRVPAEKAIAAIRKAKGVK